MPRRWLVVLWSIAVLVLSSLAAQPASAVATPGNLLTDGYAFYPRVIRLAHSGPANGTLVATVVTNDGNWVGKILHSYDGGQSWVTVGRAYDPTSSTGMCCHTLYELPSAIGTMPAGTLLWAASFGADIPNRRMSERIWRSQDQGRTWTFLAEVDKSPSDKGTWEPEFTVAADGRLVMFYSDETDGVHSQKLVGHITSDGVTWSGPKDIVALTDTAARPGMAVVRKVPDGSYLMSYEICGGPRVCEAYVRWSSDGWNWGNPADAGTRVRTADGRYPASTPTITVSGNTVLLNSMRVRNANGTFAAGDGRMVFANAASGRGNWYEVTAPVQVSDPGNGVCPTWSNPLLGSIDGKSVLHIATDYDSSGTCRAYVNAGPTSPVGTRSAAEASQAYTVPNQEHYFGRQPDGTLRHWFWDSRDGFHADTWGTGLAGEPATLVYGTQQHAFWRSTGGGLEHTWWDAAGSGSYHDVWGSGLAGDPAALVDGNAQHVWAVDGAGNLRHWWWAPGQPLQSDTWGSGVVGRPSVMLVNDEQHAFARTTGGAIRHWWWNAAQGMQAETIGAGAGVAHSPVVAQIGDAQHVWAVTSAGELRHWWWNPRQSWQSDTWASSVTGRPAFLQVGSQQHIWTRSTAGTLEHYWWAPGQPIQHNTWSFGIASDPTAKLIGSSQHVWATDTTGTAQHWWTQDTSLLHNTWGS
jgi:hypothetical protein